MKAHVTELGAALYTFDQVADFVQDQSVIGLKQRHQINSVFQRFWKRFLSGDISHRPVIPEEMNTVAHVIDPQILLVSDKRHFGPWWNAAP
jgi:hypothetical protein